MEQSLLLLVFLNWICLGVTIVVGEFYSADEMGAMATGTLGTAAGQALHKYHIGFSQPHYGRQLVGLQ